VVQITSLARFCCRLGSASSVAVSVSSEEPSDSPTGLPLRVRKQKNPEVERRALDDCATVVDHKAKPPMLGEERQAMPAAVRIDASLGKVCDLSRLHRLSQPRQRETEASATTAVDPNGAVAEFDRFHAAPRVALVLALAG
jgi:hypothetical protein